MEKTNNLCPPFYEGFEMREICCKNSKTLDYLNLELNVRSNLPPFLTFTSTTWN